MSRIGIVSLGCPKALVDSERIVTQLRSEGYEVFTGDGDADLVVINTCGFIESAVEESLGAIGDAIAGNGRVIVTGCLGTKADAVRAAHPEVLAVTGPAAYADVLHAVHTHLPAPPHDPRIDLVPAAGIRLTPRHYAYLKISEGCNHRCSFCIIPQLRGDLVSRPIGSVLEEARRLVDSGVRELLVISQDTSAYGVDLRYKLDFWGGRPVKTRFYELCSTLGELGAWVRLHYVYPYPHVDDVIPLMRDGVVLPYLDIPFQHAAPRVLKAMRRPAASERVLERIAAWRTICPELTLRSTFIVGFPGETDEDFEALLGFLEDARVDRAGCFVYSPIDGADANALPDAVEPWLAQERYERFMQLQAEISREQLEAKVGRAERVLIDAVDEEGIWGRSRGDAPEIDGRVRLDTNRALSPGEFVDVRITAVLGDHDLVAVPRA